jgi:hypothetical protein
LWADTSVTGVAVVPTGGTTGQVLTKNSSTNYDAGWSTPAVAGLLAIAPTSVTNGSLSSYTTTLSGTATSVTLNGIFSADYENYIIIARLSFTGGDAYMQLTNSGTPVTTATYNYHMTQAYQGTSPTVQGVRTGGASYMNFMANGNGVYQSATCDVFAPYLATPTMFQISNLRNDGSYGTPANYLWFGNNSNSTSYDGLKITAGGNITGTIMVYGRKG